MYTAKYNYILCVLPVYVYTCVFFCMSYFLLPTIIYLPYRVFGTKVTAVGRSQLLARWPGTLSRILSGIPRAAQTVLIVKRQEMIGFYDGSGISWTIGPMQTICTYPDR